MPASFKMTEGDLAAVMQQVGGYITKAVNDRIEDAMLKVQSEAKKRAPVDHGNLESAIKIAKGDYRRSWTVYVDGSMPDDTGKYTVGDYAVWLHEGVYNLGPKSLEKQASSDGLVGRKYLENPFREIINESLIGELQAAFEAAVLNRRAAKSRTRDAL